MAKQIFVFIVLLRALAAMVITNAHYTNVYPSDIIANGGLLGDVLFFAISGYCLSKPNINFGRWYIKRFLRIYVVVWIITLVYLLLGFYTMTDVNAFISIFIWPTSYHFVGSIIVLYVPFYCIVTRINLNQKNYLWCVFILFVIQFIIYLAFYDKSYYHIDVVREPMIWFIFLQSMLLGAYYRNKSIQSNSKKESWLKISLLLIFLGIYFCSKLYFVKVPEVSEYQILNQVILFVSLCVLFNIFNSFEYVFQTSIPASLNKIFKFFADHTLEIYLVQSVLIHKCNVGPFPLNWCVITFSILISAYILRIVSQQIIKRINI